jgi:thioredoxin-related protein
VTARPGGRRRAVAIAVLLAASVALAAGSGTAQAAPKVVKPFAPDAKSQETQQTQETKAAPKLPWRDLDDGLVEAKKAGKPLLVDVVTDWCGWCKRMDRTTYADAGVRDYVTRAFVPVRLDAEDEARRATYQSRLVTWRQFADGFNVTGYPTTLFLDSDGGLITTVPGFVQPERFLNVLHYIGDGHYLTEPWDVYDKNRRAAEKTP